MPPGPGARGVLDRSGSPREIIHHLGVPQAQLEPVAVAVQGHHMTAPGDASRELGAALDLLSDQEEPGSSPVSRQDLEDLEGSLRMGAVVEGQRDAATVGEPAGKPRSAGGGGQRGRKRCQSTAHVGMIPEVQAPDLDAWLPEPAVRVSHRRPSTAPPDRLWDAARSVRLSQTRMLGRLVRWRIPGTPPGISFDQLFREAPFMLLEDGDAALVSGLVGRIWTLRRDYPKLDDAAEYQAWSAPGTARVLLANWVEAEPPDGAVLRSETRVEAFGVQGRIGLASVRPVIRAFQQLIWSDAMAAAVRRAEAG